MDRLEIENKAKEYIRQEQNDFFREEVEKLLGDGDFKELEDRFYTDLSFGTGGLRGVIGGGYNRMNSFTVRRATQGLANYVKKSTGEGKAVIAYDSRNYSDLFAMEAALVLCANGIKVYLFSSLRPTPELSFALRELGATTGIVITASHNPAEYNGYKVYWSDGGQIVPPHDKGIIDEVRKVSGSIPAISEEEARRKGLLVSIGKEIDDKFINMIKGYSFNPELWKSHGNRIKVVFTPLHGAGTMLVERVLEEMGVSVITVPQQREPDGDFPTVQSPNPEEASAMKMALDLARKEGADLVMGTDPDADRIGIAVPSGNDYILINGNQLGSLLADYVLSARTEQGNLPPKPVLVKTIVTTELQRLIAESYKVSTVDVLTGFKYIAEKIREYEDTGESYIFGGEESYGFLIETEARDKDAVSSAMLAVEMALFNIAGGRSVLDHLNELYLKHGYFQEILISKYFKGISGLEIMSTLMENLRKDPPHSLGGIQVTVVRDYRDGTTKNISSGNTEKDIPLPSSNVLQFLLEDGSIMTARPSGTEPKIKFYASCREKAGMELSQAKLSVGEKIEGIRKDLNSLVENI